MAARDEADRLVSVIQSQVNLLGGNLDAANAIAFAQVHATLAVADQLAEIIALARDADVSE
jgi:hypothetical protein